MSAPTETRCNTCGRPVTTADRFCGFCGARLDGESATPTPQDTGEHRPHIDRILTALRAATIGEYDIAGELGRGGMAVVFLAHDLSLNRKVAIKVLLPELLYTEGMDRRFKHEARIAAKLDHPNILVIHGVREANDLLFIVMKLVEGLPLSAIAKVAGPLPVPIVRTIVRHVAEALAYAHGEGVVHRDVKPANIMVDRRGNVVVMDFGIAKAADDAHLTRTGLVIGTPAYMSPEQCLAHSVTPASDQYSLGIVAYELLTGKTPFRGSALEMQWAHATAAPPPVRSLRPDCPADLDAAVLRMMAKSPADRWPTLQDVSHAMTDDPATVSTARAALVSLVAEGPGRRDPTLPTTPASPVPIGPGPAAAGDATTDPVRGTTAYGVPANAGPANAEPANAEPRALVSNTSLSAAPAAPAMLTLSQQRIELTTGDSVELVVELDADEQSSDGSPVEWQTTDPNVATVSRNGFVTAMAPGLAEVVCVWRGRRAVCLVHVSAATAAVAPSPAAAAPPRAVPSQEAETDPIPALGAATPARKPVVSTGRRPGRLLWMGVLAAGVAAIAIYRAVRPSTFVAALPPDAATSPATPAAPAPPPATKGSPSPAPGPLEGAKPASPTSGVGSGRTTPAASTRGDTAGHAGTAAAGQRGPRLAVGGSSTAPPPTPGKTAPVSSKTSLPASQESASAAAVLPPTVPTVPPARPDSVRLTTRVDAGAASGYGATRPAAPPSAPASSPAASTAAAAPAKDSADDRIPPAPREVASALFKEFAAAINARSFSRITGAYPQPNDPDAAKLWQDFLVFVRDYTPRATIRSTTINDSSNPPTIAAVIDFRWSSDAGFDRVRSGTFVGIAVPIPGGWQLRGVKLGKRFW